MLSSSTSETAHKIARLLSAHPSAAEIQLQPGGPEVAAGWEIHRKILYTWVVFQANWVLMVIYIYMYIYIYVFVFEW